MKKTLSFLMMSFIIFAVSCKKDKGPQTVAVTGVKVTPAAVSLTPHSEHTFTIEVYPADATNKAVTWDFDDNVVEMVEGKENTFYVPYYMDEPIVLTVTTVDGGFSDEAVISVAYPVNPTGITLSEPVAMKVGDTQTLAYTITPADACQCYEEVIWSYEPYVTLDDPTCVITMNEGTGEITAIRPGTATVTVETAIGGKTATRTITVTESSLKAASFDAWAGSTIQLTPSSAVESFEVVAKEGLVLSKGKLECSADGLVTLPLFTNANGDSKNGLIRITAKLSDGKSESCVVLSKGWTPLLYTNASLNELAASFETGKTYSMTVTDAWSERLTYGEFHHWAKFEYAENSAVANAIWAQDGSSLYRPIQIRAGEYDNYKMSVYNGDVVYEFDLTPNN